MPTAGKILIADHGTKIRETVASLFASDGYEVLIADDYDTAVEMVGANAPMLALIEVALPGKNGYKLCEYIKNEPRLSDVFVMLFSGSGEKLNKEEALWVGADEYVAGAADASELLDKASKLLSRRAEEVGAIAGNVKAPDAGEAETLLSELTFPEEGNALPKAPASAPPKQAQSPPAPQPGRAKKAPQAVQEIKVIEPAEVVTAEKIEEIEPVELTPMVESAEAKRAPTIKIAAPPPKPAAPVQQAQQAEPAQQVQPAQKAATQAAQPVSLKPAPEPVQALKPKAPSPAAEAKESKPGPTPFAVTAVPADKLQEFIEATVNRVTTEVAEDAVSKAIERIVRSEACKAVDAVVSETVAKAVDAAAAQTVSRLAHEAVLNESSKVLEELAAETVSRVAEKIIRSEVRKILKESLSKED